MHGFVQSLVVLPDPLKIFLAGLVLYAVRFLLSKWLPEAALSEIAAAVTTALFVVIGALLGLIPPEFEAIATAALTLLAVLLGTVVVVNSYLKARERGFLK
jgi:uncharacterized membrane protein YjjP (DUF1212 family)